MPRSRPTIDWRLQVKQGTSQRWSAYRGNTERQPNKKNQTNKEVEGKLEKKREVIEAENNLQQKWKPPEPPEEPQPAVPKAKEEWKVKSNRKYDGFVK